MMRGDPFRPQPDGTVAARLGEHEADAVRRIASDLIDALDHADDPSMRRLFPPAYADDPAREEEFAQMTRAELLDGKAAAARAVVDSIDAGARRRGRWQGVLDQETASCWLRVLNDARLVLGTRLDVTEDMQQVTPGDPRAPLMGVYGYLGWLQEMLIAAMAEQLPPGPEADE